MPLDLPSHADGEGYAGMNVVIPAARLWAPFTRLRPGSPVSSTRREIHKLKSRMSCRPTDPLVPRGEIWIAGYKSVSGSYIKIDVHRERTQRLVE